MQQNKSSLFNNEIIIDVTRLVSRYMAGYLPTGVDRVTIAYLQRYGENARGLVYYGSQYAVLPYWASQKVFTLLIEQKKEFKKRLVFELIKGISVCRLQWNIKGSILFSVDHIGHGSHFYKKLVHKLKLKPIYFLHDLIPVDYPEYCRPGEEKNHKVRLDIMLETGKGIITNSEYTKNKLLAYTIDKHYALPHVTSSPIAPFKKNKSPSAVSSTPPMNSPYFVFLSTIEPRKNHYLILLVWKKLVEKFANDAPTLVIIGRRGWECENTVDLLERSVMLKNHVIELSNCTDDQLSDYLYHARALIFPSFVEGFGLPLIEAILHKTPVIASNLEVFREIAGDIPEYIDPIDTKGWEKMIVEYMYEASQLRKEQLKRIDGFKPPTWANHFEKVNDFINDLPL
jgi:glycosyltransferase involved in cell wall biosynthesis